jgi:hypothetical protein
MPLLQQNSKERITPKLLATNQRTRIVIAHAGPYQFPKRTCK